MAKKEPSRWLVAAKVAAVAPIVLYLAFLSVFIGRNAALDIVPGLLGEFRRQERNARRRAKRLEHKMTAREALERLGD